MGSNQILKIDFFTWLNKHNYFIVRLQYLKKIWVFFKMMWKLNHWTKSAEILHEETAVDMLLDRKNLNFVIEIVFTQYNFCWLVAFEGRVYEMKENPWRDLIRNKVWRDLILNKVHLFINTGMFVWTLFYCIRNS